MDQQFDNSGNEFLGKLLANPADDAPAYFNNLQRLVDGHPQSGILQALLAYASKEKNLKQASAYFNSFALFKLINDVSTLPGVADDRIVIAKSLRAKFPDQTDVRSTRSEGVLAESGGANPDYGVSENYFSEHAEISHDPDNTEGNVNGDKTYDDVHISLKTPYQHDEELLNSVEGSLNEQSTGTPLQSEIDSNAAVKETAIEPKVPPVEMVESVFEDVPFETVENDTNAPDERSELFAEDTFTISTDSQPAVSETTADALPNSHNPDENPEVVDAIAASADVDTIKNIRSEADDIDDEVFDEILGIEYIDTSPEPVKQSPGTITGQQPGIGEDTEHIQESIVPGAFFTVESTPGNSDEAELSEQPLVAESEKDLDTSNEKAVVSSEQQDVAKYNDDKMPYTFMWWLEKTRQQHSGIFQPYIKPDTEETPAVTNNGTDELQQQYYENIFHLTSIEEVGKNIPQPPFVAVPKRKEQVIIERFIKEEPQIRPQSSDKLDNENKAKKSAEDKDELVTETLAGIYSDQMLYHKAIASYKKLMLKFPEKSGYFAEKIAQVEKKLN